MTISMISSRINSPRSTAAVNNSEEKRPAKRHERERHERERHEEIPERIHITGKKLCVSGWFVAGKKNSMIS
jgi:hypothetical protein